MNYLIVNDIWSIKGGTERRLIDYELDLITSGHQVYVQTSERFDEVDYNIIDTAEFHNIYSFGFDIYKKFVTKYPEKTILYPHDFYPVCHKRVLGRKLLGKFRRCEKPGFLRCIQCIGLQSTLVAREKLVYFKKARTLKLVSQFMAYKYVRLGFTPDRFIIDTQKVNKEYRVKSDSKRESRLIGFSGRDAEYKGFKVLLKALEILKSNRVDFTFEHTGDSNWLTLEDMVAFYNRAQVIVIPSIWEEPSPLVAREARACGAIVVGSDIGGVKETNPDFLFKPGDAVELADILKRILDGPTSITSQLSSSNLKPLNYLIVNDFWSVKGGTERRLIDYEKDLNSRGHNVYVQTTERFDEVDYKIIDIAEFHNLYYRGFDTLKYFLEHNPEKTIFYPHDYYPVCPMRVLGRRIRGIFYKCEKPGFFRCLQCAGVHNYIQTRKNIKLYTMARTMKLVSFFVANKFSDLGFKPDRYIIDTPVVNPLYRILPEAKRINNLIGFPGRDADYKGYKILLKALEILSNTGIDFSFEHTGDDKWFSLEEMVEFYNRVRVIVVPSIWEEPFGVVIPEAKACGALVVGSDIGGIREANPDYLFKPGDPEGLAEILRGILLE